MEKEKNVAGPKAKEEWERILEDALSDSGSETPKTEPADSTEPDLWEFEEFLTPDIKEETSMNQDEPEMPQAPEEPAPQPAGEERQAPVRRERRSSPQPQAKPRQRKPAPARRSAPDHKPGGERRKPDKYRKFRRNRFWLLGFFWLTFVFSSLVVRVATDKEMIFHPGMFLTPLFALTPAILFFVLFTICKKPKVNRGLTIGFLAVVFLLYSSQLIYYKIFKQYYTFSSMGNAAQGLSFMDTLFANLFKNVLWLVVLALPLLFMIFRGKRFFSFKGGAKLPSCLFLIAVMLVWHILTVAILPLWGTDPMTPYDMYHYTHDVRDAAAQLGLGTAFRLDAKWTIFKNGKTPGLNLDLPDPEEGEETQADESVPGESVPGESVPGGSAPAAATQDYGYNVLPDLDLEALAAAEGDSDLRDMHLYFNSIKPSKKNDHTGMFKGNNLIILTAESFCNLAIDPEITPTLYKMQTEGFYFKNFYTPIWGVSTSDGEYVALTSTIPKAGVWSFYRTGEQKNYMPLTMCAQLKKQGYTAYGYHNHDYTYYDRQLSHPNMGYIWKGMGNGMEEGVTEQWPESDIEMIDFTTPEYIGQEPFHAYYMTVSGHQLYNWNNRMAVKNRDVVDHLPLSDAPKAYLAQHVELDRALELLLQRLEEAGVADHTVIAMTGDHYPYGLTPEEMGELADYPIDTTFSMYRNACFIYKPGMKTEVIEEPCCSMDFLPTLSNLFGLDFDSRLYMGRDVFSDAPPLIIFKDRSWITDKAMYNANNGEVTSMTGEEVSDDYVQKMKSVVSNKFAVSANILDMDYWNVLFGDEREQNPS